MLVNPDMLGALVFVGFVAFLVALAAGEPVIAWLRRIKFGQNINEDAPESHQKKQGTPSSGGVLMVLGVTVALLAYALVAFFRPILGVSTAEVLAIYLVFVAHAALGFLDDTLKAKRGKSLGLKAREKLAIQFVIAIAFAFWIHAAFPGSARTTIALCSAYRIDLGGFYYAFVVLLFIGMSNATNLTDGLDGLATGLSISAAIGLTVTLALVLHGLLASQYSSYGSMLVDVAVNASGSAIFCAALIGACLGFLWFNAHPARVFMGDTGSLALGAAFAAIGVINKIEVPLLVICLVFLAEAFSVVIQVGVFKMTGGRPNGRRVFRMAPLHHHFELSGWPETQVVARFCIVGVIAAALGTAYAAALQQ